MDERLRLLSLMEIYDSAIEELYVLGDRALVDFTLRLERRLREAAEQLARLDGQDLERVSHWVATEIASAKTLSPFESRLARNEAPPLHDSQATVAPRISQHP
jgi:hypothetical protein